MGLTMVGLLAALVWTSIAYGTRRREVLGGADEAYLWYGVQRVLAGEQPLRDFRSYEPGRYWLCALAARILRRVGVVGNRLTAHVLLGGALSAVAISAGAAGAPTHGLVALPLLVLGWEHTQYKLFDLAAMLLVVAGGIAALGGGALGHTALGVAVGAAGVVGVNLGLYGAVAGGVVLATGALLGSTTLPDVGVVVVGGLLGAGPLLAWWVVVPGTWHATIAARVTTPAARGSTNLPLPVPWPWRPATQVRGADGPVVAWIVRAALGALPVLALAAAAWSLTRGDGPHRVVVPLTAVGLALVHHALSRADLNHVGRAAGMLSGALAMLPGTAGFLAATALSLAALRIVWSTHPRALRRRRPDGFATRDLGDDVVWLPRGFAAQLDAVREHLAEGEGLAAVPYGVGLVAATRRRSSVTDTYCVYPASVDEDASMYAELQATAPTLVLVDAHPLDGDPDRSFPVTHPRTWRWLCDHAVVVLDSGRTHGAMPSTVTLMRVEDR